MAADSARRRLRDGRARGASVASPPVRLDLPARSRRLERLASVAAQRANRLAALHLAARQLGICKDERAVFDVLREQALAISGTRHVWAGRYDVAANVLDVWFWVGDGQRLPEWEGTRSVGDGLSAEVLRRRETVATNDYAAQCRRWNVDPCDPDTVGEREGIPWVGVPLRADDRVLGILCAYAQPGAPFDVDVVETLETLAAHASAALDNLALRAEDVHRRAEAEARAAELEAVLESIAEGVLVTDASGRLRLINRVGAAIWHVPPNVVDPLPSQSSAYDVRYLDSGEPIPPDHTPVVRALRGETVTGLQILQRVPDTGLDVAIVVSISPIRGADGVIIGAVGVFRDVTRERERNEADARAHRQRALGELAHGMAHDLNNTLALILGHADLLAQQLGDHHPGADLAHIICQGVEEAAAAVRRLQRFARTQPSALSHRVDVSRLLTDTIELTRPRWRTAADAPAGGIDVQVACAPGVPPVLGDPGELHELLTNLVLNAVDAMPGGGRLALAARDVDGGVELLVGDSGVGMPREVQARAFDPYFTTKGERGTGLGLALVESIAQRHRGRVSLESAPTRGTTIRVWLPAAPPEEAAGPTPAREPGRALRVLAVEDEAALGRMLQRLLEGAGHEVMVCLSGADAVARFAADPSAFDAVLTDVGMPGFSGWQVCRAVRDARPGVPVVLVTGWGATISDAELQRAGVSAVVAKPYRRQHLLDVLDRVTATA